MGLEPALGNGADLDAVDTEEALWDALTETLEFVAEGAHQAALERDRQAAEQPGGNLAASLVVGDCIENARGYTQGGARYNHCNWNVIGLANAIDSLAAFAVEYLRPGVQNLSGRAPEEFYASPGLIFDIVQTDDRGKLRALFASQSRVILPATIRFCHLDGSTVWVEFTGVPVGIVSVGQGRSQTIIR